MGNPCQCPQGVQGSGRKTNANGSRWSPDDASTKPPHHDGDAGPGPLPQGPLPATTEPSDPGKGGGATESNAGATTTGSTGFLGPRGPTRHDAPRAPWSPWNASWGPGNAWSSTQAGSWDARTTFRHPSVNSTGSV